MNKIEKNPEQYEATKHEAPQPEETAHHERLAHERERLSAEKGHEGNQETARKEALESASSSAHEKEPKEEVSRVERRPGAISKKERETSFESTMDDVRTHMSNSSRTFSKVIHNPTVEKISETLGSTVARPNAVASGAFFAFLFTLGFYLVGRMNGYPLSGSETMMFFLLGWIVGLVFDFLKTMVTGKR